MKKSLTIVMIVLLVSLVVACSPEHKHTMDAGKQTTDPTCTKDGVMTYTCTSCGYEETKSIPATGHIKPDASKWQPADSEDDNAVTCYTDGIYEYRCTVCGAKDTVVVTPKMAKDLGLPYEHVTRVGNKYVHILNTGHTALDTNVPESAVKYDSSKVTAETMFVPKTEIAYCATCGDELGALNKIVKSEKDVATYKKMVGTWVFTDNSNSKATKIYYLNVEEKEDNGTLTGKTAWVTSELKDGVWTTTTASSSPAYSSLFATEDSGVRSIKLGKIDASVSKYYKLSENKETGKFTLLSYESSEYTGDATDVLSEEGKSLKFHENHLHGYNTDASKSDSIAKDTDLVPMTYLGYNYASNDGKHYVACSTCGLSYYGSNHDTAAADGSCSVCSYKTSDYAEVTVASASDPLISALVEDFESNSTVFATAAGDSAAITKLTKAKDLLEKTLEVLTESGCEDDIVTKDIPALLATSGSGVTVNNSVVYALAAANTSGGDKDSDDYSTVLGRVLGVLGSANNATYDSKKDCAWKMLKAYTDGVGTTNSALKSFYVKKGALLALDSNGYTPFNAKTIEIADGTSWSGTGYVQSIDGGFKVKDKCTLTFALKADLSE